MRFLLIGPALLLSVVSATAGPSDPATFSLAGDTLRTSFSTWSSCESHPQRRIERSLVWQPQTFEHDPDQQVHAAAIEHSDGYQTRAKIHKYASFATLPLFATEVALGQSLYDGTESNGKKTAHAVVGAGIVGLFAVNTVTGLWNMFGEEGRRETDGRTLRLVHGLLMMAADVGFVATTAAAPSEGHNGAATFNADKVTHRNLAIASISLGTAGYLLMLFGNH